MKILLFGKSGQVGWELNRSLLPLGGVVALGREDADLSEPESLRKIVREIMPDVIVNAAAYTAVDKAEEEEDLATTINGTAPGVLAEEASKLNALLIHYSTDYVFDGVDEGKYAENDNPNPVNAYGRSKLAGEKAIQASECDFLIFRTSWVFSSRGHNFLLSIMRLAVEREKLNIVNDQTGAPSWARYIADVSADILRQSLSSGTDKKFSSGVYNLVCSGETTWYEFAKTIIDASADMMPDSSLSNCEVNPIPSTEYRTLARRPENSSLSIDRIKSDYGIQECHWKVALNLCMNDIVEYIKK